jgi:hypothetical protein
MRADKEVVLEAVKQKAIIVKYASSELQNDKDVGVAAMNQDKRCYEFLGEKLKEDEDILKIKEA